MVKSDWSYVDKWARKLKALEYLGGKCIKCGETNLLFIEFHHNTGSKEKTIGDLMGNRWSDIQNELPKCVALCRNCHKEEHYIQSSRSRDQNNKSLILKLLGKSGCEICGYNKCGRALEFHHQGTKSFDIGSVTNRKRWKNIEDIDDYIKEELQKCTLLCSNHHHLEHINIEKFDNLKLYIYGKKIKEISKPVDIERVEVMLSMGMRQVDIRKELNVAKSTICGIVKNIRSNTQHGRLL